MIPRRKIRYYKSLLLDVFKLTLKNEVNQGQYTSRFEGEFATYLNVKYAISTSSGRGAYRLILESLNLPNHSEVILPGYTYKEMFNITKEMGFKPVLVDINKQDYNLKLSDIKKIITEKTKVIVATHILGFPCSIKEICDFARERNIYVIEDCAHALGSECEEGKNGGFGVASLFSFESTKILNTFGGGMIVTNSFDLNQKIIKRISYPKSSTLKILLKIIITHVESFLIETCINFILYFLLRSKFINKLLNALYFSSHSKVRQGNVRLSNLQSLIGLKQLKQIDERNLRRVNAVESYKKALDSNFLIPECNENLERVYYYFVILLPEKFDGTTIYFRDIASKKGVDIGILDEITDNLLLCMENFSNLENTKFVFDRALQLPLYDNITENEIKKISEVVNFILRSSLL